MDNELGENPPNFVPIATMVDQGAGCHGVCSFMFINMGVYIPLTMTYGKLIYA